MTGLTINDFGKTVVYPRRVVHVIHLAFEDQPIIGRNWTNDRSVLSGGVGKRLKHTPKAVLVA
jgi:hypothetical protein